MSLTINLAACAESLSDAIRRRKKAWTAEELADLLSLSRKHIYKLAKQQRMPSIRMGGAIRFDPEAVANWLENRCVG
ncbi:hypothetical protein BH10ACI4_BH10ACI4_16990 [soil metagenome]